MRHMTWSRFLDTVNWAEARNNIVRLYEDHTTEGSTALKWVAMNAGVDQATAQKVLRSFFGHPPVGP